MKPGRRAARLVALAMLGCLLFNYPVLALFNRPATLLGVPLLYAWIFGAWAVLIVLMARVVERDD
jgi:predicted permease